MTAGRPTAVQAHYAHREVEPTSFWQWEIVKYVCDGFCACSNGQDVYGKGVGFAQGQDRCCISTQLGLISDLIIDSARWERCRAEVVGSSELGWENYLRLAANWRSVRLAI
jgi:hypothetical protein